MSWDWINKTFFQIVLKVVFPPSFLRKWFSSLNHHQHEVSCTFPFPNTKLRQPAFTVTPPTSSNDFSGFVGYVEVQGGSKAALRVDGNEARGIRCWWKKPTTLGWEVWKIPYPPEVSQRVYPWKVFPKPNRKDRTSSSFPNHFSGVNSLFNFGSVPKTGCWVKWWDPECFFSISGGLIHWKFGFFGWYLTSSFGITARSCNSRNHLWNARRCVNHVKKRYPPNKKHDTKTSTIWRCISFWKVGLFNIQLLGKRKVVRMKPYHTFLRSIFFSKRLEAPQNRFFLGARLFFWCFVQAIFACLCRQRDDHTWWGQ